MFPKPRNGGQIRRYLECAVFVLAWKAGGSLFQLGGTGYLLLGVPLVVIFQLLVVRRPLHQLWVREAKPFRLDWRVLAIASALVVVPTWVFFCRVRPYGMMFLVISAGVVTCAFALRHQRVEKLLGALPSVGTAVVIGCAVFASFAIWRTGDERSAGVPFSRLPLLFADFYCMTLAGFVVEEVVFRGAIDSHLASSESTRLENWMSAAFVSILWGLWHLPLRFLYPSRSLGFIALALVINVLFGIPLSFCWRKSGTLVLPSAVHALCDAYRNVLSL